MGTFYVRTISDNVLLAHYLHGYINPPSSRTIPSAMWRSVGWTNGGFDARNINAERYVDNLAPGSMAKLTNNLHSRFASKLGESSSFGATLTAESRQTFGMVTGTILRAVSAARHVRKLNFGAAAKELGLPYKERTVTRTVVLKNRVVDGRKRPSVVRRFRMRVFKLPSGREVQKTLANGWLLWSYGVKPLASDIYNGLDVLQRPLFYKQKIRVTASISASKSENSGGPGTGYWRTSNQWSASALGACGATVSVSNPNHLLLNKMGFANPFQWVLEAIPLSFIADWFSNLSQVIGQFNEYLGYSIEHPWQSYKHAFNHTFSTDNPYKSGPPRNEAGFVFRRTLSLPVPKLVFAYERFELQRGLNAISLLIGLLPRK